MNGDAATRQHDEGRKEGRMGTENRKQTAASGVRLIESAVCSEVRSSKVRSVAAAPQRRSAAERMNEEEVERSRRRSAVSE